MAERRPHVVQSTGEDGLPAHVPEARVTVLVEESSGSRELLQRVFVLRPGASAYVGHFNADDVLYVAGGTGRLWKTLDGDSHDLRPGMAALVPRRVPTLITNLSHEELEVVSVLSPPPFHGAHTLEAHGEPLAVLHEDDQEDLPAGEDRHFRLLIGPKHGARNVTQFVGFIDRSRA
ncbi:MAG TPA: cupin domain-containing protein, partial [Actinomycetota bacterium]|nr:cupin domain-containing protein [Actinomycetota bacterium]